MTATAATAATKAGKTAPASKPRKRSKPVPRLGRSDRSAFGLWFWEIDRVLLLLVAVLFSIGLIAVAAASPATAERYSEGTFQLSPLHYFWRQLIWVALGLPVMIVISTLPHVMVRRLALAGAIFFGIMLMAVPVLGVTVNGAKRWIGLGFAQFQPSEFLKPLFIVALAWLLSLRAHDKDLPVIPISGVLTAFVGLLLMMQPDFGQTIIFASVWFCMVMITGMSWRIIGGLAGAGFVGIVTAYMFYSVARTRIDNFLFANGDTYQTDMAHNTITSGGFFGTGPGGGEMKFRLPEAHTDYIFSVIGEEFGLIACIAIVALFTAMAVRVFIKTLDEDDPFLTLASAGLIMQLTVQSFINMSVNVGIAPSKGMTLPFISYGGSSMLALCIGFGMLLAFTRKNPYLKRSPYVVKWGGKP
jgi:cell division protein FtsW